MKLCEAMLAALPTITATAGRWIPRRKPIELETGRVVLTVKHTLRLWSSGMTGPDSRDTKSANVVLGQSPDVETSENEAVGIPSIWEDNKYAAQR